jgi:four helix bundle protein
MSVARNHKDLIVWQKSVALASKIYSATRKFPDEERFGLSSQMRRSAVSIASNIAEGAGRNRRGEYIRFLDIARGSASELETHVLVTTDLQLLDPALHVDEDVAEVGRLLAMLIRKLQEQRPRD